MAQLKKISKAAVPGALKMVERYRLLNEPAQAESICLDVLAVDPKNKQAQVMRILALTDQFRERSSAVDEAMEAVEGLSSKFDREYYTGIIYERRARAAFHKRSPGAGYAAYEWFQTALECFKKADKLSTKSNNKPILRWNAIVRTLERHPELQPAPENTAAQLLE